MKTILYIHGMGGGGDSRIPRLLRERFEGTDLRCIVRTYDFDPETGAVTSITLKNGTIFEKADAGRNNAGGLPPAHSRHGTV